jgi:hypothetical protein
MSQIKTEVVLEFDGRKLVSGSVEDFILDPKPGSHYFYEGSLYEVTFAVETIGDACSPQGSMLIDLLNTLFPDPTMASALFGGMSRVNGGESELKTGGIVTTGLNLIMAAQKERLLYLRLHCTHRGVQQKSLVSQLVEGALAGSSNSTLHS